MTPALRDAINALLPTECRLPWIAGPGSDPKHAGTIYTADGFPIAIVDPWHDLGFPDEAAGDVAQAIALAVNAACGHDTEGSADAL